MILQGCGAGAISGSGQGRGRRRAKTRRRGHEASDQDRAARGRRPTHRGYERELLSIAALKTPGILGVERLLRFLRFHVHALDRQDREAEALEVVPELLEHLVDPVFWQEQRPGRYGGLNLDKREALHPRYPGSTEEAYSMPDSPRANFRRNGCSIGISVWEALKKVCHPDRPSC